MVEAFEGNKAETATITSFMAAHQLAQDTVVADTGMISEANTKAIEAARLSFILGMKIPDIPYVVAQWRREHPGQQVPGFQRSRAGFLTMSIKGTGARQAVT